ncbi:MAG: hypothetical protein ACR2LY_07240 [Thermoleophilaceae bacterium]
MAIAAMTRIIAHKSSPAMVKPERTTSGTPMKWASVEAAPPVMPRVVASAGRVVSAAISCSARHLSVRGRPQRA